MKVLVSPDKFKGTLTGPDAAEAIRAGVVRVLPDAEVRLLPVADGGDGTVAAVVAAGGTPYVTETTDPLGRPVPATWAMLGQRAVIEIAAASGLVLVTPTDDTVRVADSAGTGRLVRAALDAGAREVVVGLGGSATTDGGAGILRALGARFLDAAGRDLPPGGAALVRLASVDLSGLDPRLAQVPVVVCCDVRSPMTGSQGAAAVFGPQKGAAPGTVAELDRGLARLATVLAEVTDRDATATDWGGAAGGASGGLHAGLGARFRSGIDEVADLIGLDDAIAWADLVVTGEGSFDEQTLTGKGPVGVALRARDAGRPVVVVAGRCTLDRPTLATYGVVEVGTLVDAAGSLDAALAEPARWTGQAAEHAVRRWTTRP